MLSFSKQIESTRRLQRSEGFAYQCPERVHILVRLYLSKAAPMSVRSGLCLYRLVVADLLKHISDTDCFDLLSNDWAFLGASISVRCILICWCCESRTVRVSPSDIAVTFAMKSACTEKEATAKWIAPIKAKIKGGQAPLYFPCCRGKPVKGLCFAGPGQAFFILGVLADDKPMPAGTGGLAAAGHSPLSACRCRWCARRSTSSTRR